MKTLDLGCGNLKSNGALGADIIRLPGVDILIDLSSLPFPFADNAFDSVYLNDVIEHLPNTVKTLEEIHRISRPNGKLYIRVVNWNSHYTAMDPTHLHAFTENSFDFFGKRKNRSYYTKARFNVNKVDYQYNALAERVIRKKSTLKTLSFYLNNILEGLSFELEAIKDNIVSQSVEDWDNFYTVLRCPYCLEHVLAGKLKNLDNKWLVCQNNQCNRKYPIIDGTPILLLDEGEKWINFKEYELPNPPEKEYPLISGSTNKSTEPQPEKSELNENIDFEHFCIWGLNRYEIIKKRIKIAGISILILLFLLIGYFILHARIGL